MRKFTLWASGAAIAALVLTGCGDNPPANQGGGGSGGGGSDVGTLKLLAENVAKKSAEKSSAHMVFKAEAAGESFEGEGDIRLGADPAMKMTMTVPGQGELEMRLIGEAFYVKTPEEIEPGKPWLKLDANGNDPISQSLGAAVKQMREQGDPSQLLKQLEQAGEITGRTQEDLNGKPTTKYSVTIDVAKAAQASGMKDALEAAEKAGVKNFPLEVWVDQENLPVRMAMDIAMKDPSSGQTANAKFSVDYSDWGKPVEVTAPSPSEVAELPTR